MFLQNLVTFLILLMPTVAAAADPQHRSYDAAWWHSVDKDQRIGWLAGYIDCETSHGNKSLLGVSWYALEPQITKFYESNPSQKGLEVYTVVSKIAGHLISPKDEGGSVGGETGGGFDGEYWRQAAEQREGFVQGYLACHGNLKSAKATFSKSAEWYASQISKWYGIIGDDINSKRASVPISAVLFKFKDGSPKSSQRKQTRITCAALLDRGGCAWKQIRELPD